MRPLPPLHLRRNLLTGVLLIFPLWITWLVFSFILTILSDFSAPGVNAVFDWLATAFPAVAGLFGADWFQSALAVFLTLLALYGLGFAADRVLGRRVLQAIDNLIERIPLVQPIYSGAKKLLTVLQKKPDGTQRVVLIEFPSPGMRTLGFLTRVFRDPRSGEDWAAVYVPTTPNPTGGYLEIVPLTKLIPTDLSVDQAMAFILSGGAVGPETLPFGIVDMTEKPRDP